MSFFKNIFGKKEPPAPSTSESIQKLRDTENMLLKKQEFLEQKVEQEHELAKKNASTNKRSESNLRQPTIDFHLYHFLCDCP
jgi:hypothetical protein